MQETTNKQEVFVQKEYLIYLQIDLCMKKLVMIELLRS